MIKISICNETYPAPRDDEDYCHEPDGVVRDEYVSFRELVDLMREHYAPSCSPCDYSADTWLEWPDMQQDYRTGEYEQESIHYSRDNDPRYEKYWRLAMRAANIK